MNLLMTLVRPPVCRLITAIVRSMSQANEDGMTLLTRKCVQKGRENGDRSHLLISPPRLFFFSLLVVGKSFYRILQKTHNISSHLSVSKGHEAICLTMDLHDAAKKGDLERSLVEQGADKNMYNSSGFTPLHRASWAKHLNIVQYLVEQGATIDKTTRSSSTHTPLSAAASYGHLDIVRYLLEQGADRDKADLEGDTPLHDAARYGHLQIAMLLMS